MIVGLDSKVIYDQADLVNALDLLGVNDTVKLHIVRTTDQVGIVAAKSYFLLRPIC